MTFSLTLLPTVDAEEARAIVEERIAEGPFAATDDESADRIYTVHRAEQGVVVREQWGKDARVLASFLPSRFAARLAIPVTWFNPLPADFGEGFTRCVLATEGEVTFSGEEATAPEVGPPLAKMSVRIDPQRQEALLGSFEATLDKSCAKLFPVVNRQKTARLVRLAQKVFGPDERYRPGIFRYDRTITMTLQLRTHTETPEGDMKLNDVREGRVTFASYQLPADDGSLVHRGRIQRVAYDEYADDFLASQRRSAESIRVDLSSRPSLEGIGPELFFSDGYTPYQYT